MSQALVIGGLYRHYKGQDYRVHGVALHSETLEDLVYYECLYPCAEGQFWVRPRTLFLGDCDDHGTPRFRYIQESKSETP